MGRAWLKQWTDSAGMVSLRSKADIAAKGRGGATHEEFTEFIRQEGGGQWTLIEVTNDYILIKTPAPKIVAHVGAPTLDLTSP